jgi:hypothetical protein|tara:strand:+ start:3106 stop:3546 length:441 start_codon:yes stop_codon:yes gene_type:complete
MASDESLDDIKKEIIQAISEGKTQRDKVADSISAVEHGVERTTNLIEKTKDNIAWVLGLPTALGGAFGFLWESSSEEAALQYQVEQLEVAVADLKASGDLLGGGTKNWSLDPSAAPGGSLTVMLVGLGVVILLGLLFWYQSRRRRQ